MRPRTEPGQNLSTRLSNVTRLSGLLQLLSLKRNEGACLVLVANHVTPVSEFPAVSLSDQITAAPKELGRRSVRAGETRPEPDAVSESDGWQFYDRDCRTRVVF